MKKTIAIMAALVMAFGGAAYLPQYEGVNTAITVSAASYDFAEGDYQCVNLADGTVAIVKYTGKAENLTIPSKLGGKKVTVLDNTCFQFTSGLKKVTIPNTVTKLNEYAFFGCWNMESITIPNSVTYIGKSCFFSCDVLKTLNIPDSVTYIGEQAFGYCVALESCKLPKGLTEIKASLFTNCEKLKSLDIPSSVTSIDVNAFDCCTSLKQLTIPKKATVSVNAMGFYYPVNSDGSITERKLIPNFTMYVYAGSPGETYAKKNGVSYKYVSAASSVKGDANGDGKININDVAMVAAHIKGSKSMNDAAMARANVNGDKVVDIVDLSKIVAHVKGVKSL